MGGTGSGRKSVKGQAIKLVLDMQIMLNELLYEDLDSNLSREDLKGRVNDKIQQAKKTQEELERL